MYQRLTSDDGEVFYGKISACQITAELYRLSQPTEKASIIELFGKLVIDELSMVRKAGGIILTKLMEYIESDVDVPGLTEIIKAMTIDEHVTVRAQALEMISTFAIQIKKFPSSTAIYPELSKILKATVEDPSWKIRQVLAKNFGSYPIGFPSNLIISDLFPSIITLIQDAEPDVRVSGLEGIVPYVTIVGGEEFLHEFIPHIHALLEDPVPNVRKAFIDACIEMIGPVKALKAADSIIDVITKLAEDEDPLVRLRLIKKMKLLYKEVPYICVKLNETLRKYFTDSNWRVRKEIAHSMPYAVEFVGIEFFNNFLNLHMELLHDGVDEVREECARTIPLFIKAGNPTFFKTTIFPAVKPLLNQKEFLLRLAFLNSLDGVVTCLDLPEDIYNEALDLTVTCAKDKVPNIRIRASQVLGNVVHQSNISETIKLKIRPILTELSQEKDKDVKYFATESLKFCS
jgi:serine/threonine-protein phosphatase 2A regulatory subunit A